MSYIPFTLNSSGPILEITLSKGKANVISAADSRELNRMWEAFRDNPEQRFAIITGKGEKFFCAGWDLKNVAESGEASDSDYGAGGFGGLNYPRNFNKPVICAVNGIACGGGFEVMLGCDIIVAEEHATFALPEIKVGVLPDCGVVKLRRRVPYHVAVDFMMTGRWMDAEEGFAFDSNGIASGLNSNTFNLINSSGGENQDYVVVGNIHDSTNQLAYGDIFLGPFAFNLI